MANVIKIADEFIDFGVEITSKLEDELARLGGKTVNADALPGNLGSKGGVKSLEIKQSRVSQYAQALKDDKGNVNIDDVLNTVRANRKDAYTSTEIGPQRLPVRINEVADADALESYHGLIDEFAVIDDAQWLRDDFSPTSVDELRRQYNERDHTQIYVQEWHDTNQRFNDLDAYFTTPLVEGNDLALDYKKLLEERLPGLRNTMFDFTPFNVNKLREKITSHKSFNPELDQPLLDRLDKMDEFLAAPKDSTNAIYNFPAEAYSDITLPDTDMSTYRVRLYDNKAVDKKGISQDMTHFTSPNIFHSRTDSPQPGVHRIQELQSDVQNRLTSKKNTEISFWQKEAEQMEISHGDIAKSYRSRPIPFEVSDALKVKSGEIRSEVGMKWLEETSKATGLDFHDIRNPVMLNVSGVLQETMTAVGNKFVDGANFDTVRNTPLGFYLKELAAGRAPLEMADETKKLLKTHTSMTDAEIGSLEDIVSSAPDDYEFYAGPALEKYNANVHTERMLRRRAPERTEAALSKWDRNNATKAESEEASEQLTEAYEDVLTKNDLVVTGGPDGTEDLANFVTMSVTDKDNISSVFTEIKQFYKSSDLEMPRSTLNMGSQIFGGATPSNMGLSPDGIKIFDDVYGAGTGKQINDMTQEIYDSATSKTTKALAKSSPLKSFPKAKEFELEVPWRKQGIQSEVTKAIQEKQGEVWLNVNAKGTEDLARGPGPQAAYETNGRINKEFRAVARKIKAEIVEEDGYLKMKLPQATAGLAALASFSTYAATDRDDLVEAAMANGYTEQEATDFWYNDIKENENEYQAAREEGVSAGYSDEELDGFENEMFQLETFAEPDELFDAGEGLRGKLEPETVVQIGQEIGADPYTPDGINAIYSRARNLADPEGHEERLKAQQQKLQQYVAGLEEIYSYTNAYQEIRGLFGDEEAQAAEAAKTLETRGLIMEAAQARGYDLQWNEEASKWVIYLPNGDVIDATPDVFDMLERDLGSIGMSMSGAVAGARFVQPVSGPLYAAPGGWTSLAGLTVSALGAGIGGFAAGVLGDQFDYLAALSDTDEEFSWDMAYSKMGGSSKDAALGELAALLITGVWKGSRVGLQAARLIKDGNLNGAYEMLLNSTGLSEKQAMQAVRDWEILNNIEAPATSLRESARQKEKALAVLPTTRAGGENIVAAVAERDPKASGVIANEVAARANALTEALALPTTNKEFATRLANEYNEYLVRAKEFYQVVKDNGVNFAPDGYKFNIDRLVLRPLKTDLLTRMAPGADANKLRKQMALISELNRSRSFDSLLTLRQTIEDIRLNAKRPRPEDVEVFDTILGRIDNEVDTAVLGSGKEGSLEWYADWTAAKNTRTDIIRLQRRRLGKLLAQAADPNRTGAEVTYETITNEIMKSGRSVKGILPDLMKQLPVDTQIAVERDMIRAAVEAFTVGKRGEFQAMQFPEIANILSEYNFQFPESKAMLDLISDFGKVYQNDVGLAYASGKIHSVQFQSYLTTNPIVRAQYEIASAVFNRVQEIRGGTLGDSAAMVRHVARLLEEPLNPKNVADALETAKGDVALEKAIQNLSKEAAASKHTGGLQTSRVKMYKDGRGTLWAKPGKGRTETGTIPIHRLATEQDVLEQYKVTNLDDLTIFNRAELINKGLMGIGKADGSLFKLADDLF